MCLKGKTWIQKLLFIDLHVQISLSLKKLETMESGLSSIDDCWCPFEAKQYCPFFLLCLYGFLFSYLSYFHFINLVYISRTLVKSMSCIPRFVEDKRRWVGTRTWHNWKQMLFWLVQRLCFSAAFLLNDFTTFNCSVFHIFQTLLFKFTCGCQNSEECNTVSRIL